MGDPTVYRFPRKSPPTGKVSDRAKQKWEKHRKATGKDTKLPKLKN
jgi:hypothetical protein